LVLYTIINLSINQPAVDHRSLKSGGSPSLKSTKAPTIKSTKAPALGSKSRRRELSLADDSSMGDEHADSLEDL
jgi:hypothetical protein